MRKLSFSQLGQSGLDYIHVTEYNAWNPAFDSTDTSLAALAKRYGNIPVIANGNLEDPERARNLIEKEEADVVALGKGALANHDWVRKVKNGDPIAPFKPEQILRTTAKLKEFEV